jgi:hypothetical protein
VILPHCGPTALSRRRPEKPSVERTILFGGAAVVAWEEFFTGKISDLRTGEA